MDTVVTVIQIVVALGIVNVWILRPGRSTGWRGGQAKNMKEEFAVYGLPAWFIATLFSLLGIASLISLAKS